MPTTKRKKESTATQREVFYPNIVADVCVGETAITIDDAKELLGWEEAADGKTYCKEIFALSKLKVVLTKNVTNRPIYTSVVQTLKQEILRKRWVLNGEPIIVGKTGLVLNGQHTLIALVLACLEWESDPEHWTDYWPSSPTLEKIVVSGVDESDNTVNTMDTCKPRSLADVLYRSEYFSSLHSGERKVVAKMADYAIRLLWHRTGAKFNAFAPIRTHAESLDFIARHPKLLEAVRHVNEESGKESCISTYTHPGYTAGLLYLMGCSSTDPGDYRASANPDESTLDWSQWDKACDFIVLLSAGGSETSAVKRIMANSLEEGSLGVAERWGIISNAWLAYSSGKAITEKSLALSYLEDDNGYRRLSDHPSVGGIDLGDPSTADEDVLAMADPTPEEIAKEAAKLKGKNIKAKEEVPKVKPKKLGLPSKAGSDWDEGDVAWVRDPEGDYLGQVVGHPWKCDDGERRIIVRTQDNDEWDVLYSDLSLEKSGHKKITKVAAKAPSPKGQKEYKLGSKVWAIDEAGNHWKGKIIELTKNGAKLVVEQGFQGCGTTRMVWQRNLNWEQPGLEVA